MKMIEYFSIKNTPLFMLSNYFFISSEMLILSTWYDLKFAAYKI